MKLRTILTGAALTVAAVVIPVASASAEWLR